MICKLNCTQPGNDNSILYQLPFNVKQNTTGVMKQKFNKFTSTNCSIFLILYWQILENSSSFREYLFSFCKISGHELDRFLENSSKYGLVCVTSRNSWNINPRLNALIWMSFPEIGLYVTKFTIG